MISDIIFFKISPNGNIHFISSHRPEMEILARLAVTNELAQIARRKQEEQERPPRYSIAVAETNTNNPENGRN